MYVALELLAGCGMIFGASLNPSASRLLATRVPRQVCDPVQTELNFFGGVNV